MEHVPLFRNVNSLSLVSIQNHGAMMMEFRLSASMISCLICLRQINIDFHNTNFRLMGDYKNFVEAFDAFIKIKILTVRNSFSEYRTFEC